MRAVVLLAVLVVAGCLSPSPDPPGVSEDLVEPPAPEASTTPADTLAAGSDCADCRVEVDERSFTVGASVSANGQSVVSAGGNPLDGSGIGPVLELTDGATFVQAELTWEALTPNTARLRLAGAVSDAWWEKATKVIASNATVGPSTLVLTLSGWKGPVGMVNLTVAAAELDPLPAGAVAAQTGKVYTSIFYGFTPPPGWLYTVDGLPRSPA